MKKVIAFVLILVISLGVFPSNNSISVAGTMEFKDVPKDGWYYEHVQFVANDPREIMVGYNGIFNPLENLTVEQFIKIMVHAAGQKVTPRAGDYWANVYIQKGLDLGYVVAGEFTSYKRAITRAEMARMIIRALPAITGEKNTNYDENDIKKRMTDYNAIDAKLRDYVCQAYELGILVGGSDGKFNPNGNLSRASAAVVINVMLNPSKRTVVRAEDPVIEEPEIEDPPADVPKTDEFWTDSEFEQYMKVNAKDYPDIAKIDNRKIYWNDRENPNTGPTLVEGFGIPNINDMLYDYVKHMVFYANKNSNKFSASYYSKHFVSLSYDIQRVAGGVYKDIELFIYKEPYYNFAAEIYVPGMQKTPSKYKWVLNILRDPQYLDEQGWVPGMDRTKIKWTQEKYEKVFKQACIDIYGPMQGTEFYNLVMEKRLNKFYAGGVLEDSYFGIIPNTGIELAYYYSDKNQEKMDSFSTTVPEVRR